MRARHVWTIAAATFLLGVAAGALTTGELAARSLATWNDAVRISFGAEQQALSARAEREGDGPAALHHQWNVTEAGQPDWLSLFEDWEKPPPWFFVQLLLAQRVAAGVDPDGRGARRVAAMERGNLARLMEANGYPERAATEWRRASEQMGQGEEYMREAVAWLYESDGRGVREAGPTRP